MSLIDTAAENHVKLIITDEISDLMEKRHILEVDIQRVIHHAEVTGNKLLIRDTGYYLAYRKRGSVTYWVEYLPRGDEFMIYNTYSHRMEINEGVKE